MAAIFDPDVLHDVCRSSLGMPMEKMVPHLVRELSARYPGHIDEKPKWLFNNAGGAMGMMLLLHCSLTEYVLIFGTPIGTEGHTGRFWADDYFVILDGEQWAYNAGELSRRVYRPGDMHHMPRNCAQGYRIPDHCWGLEYARGLIPLMLPFAVADTMFSTLDVRTWAKTFTEYARLATGQLLRGKA